MAGNDIPKLFVNVDPGAILIGVDQALHHLTGFGLSIFMAANG